MELSKEREIEEILGHKYKGTYHEPVKFSRFVPLGVNKARGIEVDPLIIQEFQEEEFLCIW